MLNATTKLNIKNDLLKYSMASIEPVITDPVEYFIILRLGHTMTAMLQVRVMLN